MATYRTGRHWGVTIVREGTRPTGSDHWHGGEPCAECPGDDELLAVVVNAMPGLTRVETAERICELLNGSRPTGTHVEPPVEDWDWQPPDSCTCVYRPNGGADPNCPVHHGRRARGPKPPNPLGCICDGSGRTCPRHGAVI